MRPHRMKERRGASAVEFAIVAPFLFMVLIGMIEFGRAMMVQHIVTMSAREGARESILLGATVASVRTVATGHIQNSVGLGGVNIDVSPDPATAEAGTLITTNVTVPFSAVSVMAGKWFGEEYRLGASATMRKEGFE